MAHFLNGLLGNQPFPGNQQQGQQGQQGQQYYGQGQGYQGQQQQQHHQQYQQQQQQGGWGGAGGGYQQPNPQQQAAYQQYANMGYTVPHGPPPPNSQHYGNYGSRMHENVFAVNAAQALRTSPEQLHQLFEMNKSQRYNAIQGEELQRVLNSSQEIKDNYRTKTGQPLVWSLELCKIMLAMLDRSKDGMMQFNEMQELLQCMVYWLDTFNRYDADGSGFVEAHELGNIVKNIYGYSLSAKALEVLLKRYGKAMDDGRVLVSFDDFVSLSVRLRAYTEAFRARDKQAHGGHETGVYEFSYDDFLQCVLCL